ncbi:putative cullin-associated NEDD8-dissociated protein [Encephalitozoon cuniculi]|nr:putative cullin-associated NEDD8-dissociated protein [Encephalitozoon cuniculi]
MYLHKSEIEAGIEKLMKTVEDDEVLGRCRGSLREMGSLEEENIKDFIRERRDVVDVFVQGLRAKRQVPAFVIDFIYTFLVNDLLTSSDIEEIIGVISEGSWCEASKMKILQMSYYIMRYENFRGDLALSLFKSIIGMIEDRSKQVQTTAKPIAMHLVDVIFNRACAIFKNEAQSEEDELNAASPCSKLDVLEGCRSKSERLVLRRSPEFSNPIDDGISFLRYLLQNAYGSREMGYFVVDAVALVTQKSELFEYEEFKEMYRLEVMGMLTETMKRRCSSKGNVYRVLSRVVARHNCLFEKQVHAVFDEMEKSYGLFDDLEMEMFLDFLGGLDVLLFSSYAVAIRRMFFRVLEDTPLDNESGSSDAINAIGNLLSNQLDAQEKTSGRFHPSTKVFFDKFSGTLYAKLSGISSAHPSTERLLDIVLRFYAASGNRELLERFMALGSDLGFARAVCRSSIESRKHIQDSWHVVLSCCKDHLGDIIESVSIFDAEEIFFLIKAVEMLEPSGSWSSKDKVDFLLSVFNITKPIVVEPLNIRILEMILGGMLRESHGGEEYPTKVFCSVVVDYAGHLEVLTPDVESVIFTLLRKMLAKNLERSGLEILEALSEVLRLVTPEGCWDIVMECVECSCIPCLYSPLYSIIRWIVEGSGHLLDDKHFEVLIGSLYSMCLSPNSEISLKAVFIFQDIGECLMSRRAFSRTLGGDKDRDGGEEMSSAWVKYTKVLGEMASDERYIVRETAIKYLVMFLEAECDGMSLKEVDFGARNGLIPILEKGRQFVKVEDQEAHCTLVLILNECRRIIEKMECHEELCGKFLELIADGICGSDSCEVQSMCVESLGMMASKISGVGDGGRGVFQEGSDHSSEDVGFRTGIGERKSPLRLLRLRELILDTYKSVFARIPDSEGYSSGVCLDMMDLIKGFAFKSAELRVLIPLLRKFVHSDNKALQEKVLSMVESWGPGGSVFDVQLEAYNDWISFKDVHLTRMLIERIGKVLSRSSEEARYSATVMDLAEHCKERAFWEDVVRAFMKGSESIRTRAAFLSFVNGSRVIFDEAPKVGVSKCLNEEGRSGLDDEMGESTAKALKRRERVVLEFLAFYHDVLSRFAGIGKPQSHEMQPFDEVSRSDIREGYRVIFEMSELGSGLGKESICFKCYEILFHDIELIYSDVVDRIRKVLGEYNEMEMIYNGLYSRVKQREVYTILEKIWRSGNKKLVDDVKDVLVESLRSKDYRVIDHVRRCLEIILVQA